ncbi:MAG: thioredoxin domain-containing protein [Nitrososphaeria archaeon]
MTRLENERSPYLRQHASNPVDWFPWGTEAIEAARALDRPLFISIGYFSCHWCHRMNEDVFMDREVAAAMNEAFINVLVDREERPDVDTYFINIAQQMSDNVGWPLNVIATPELKPFFVFTYMQKHSYGNQIGMMELIGAIRKLWTNERSKLLTEGLIKMKQTSERDIHARLQETYESMRNLYDSANGGFGSSPKFPMPLWIMFLLYYGWRAGKGESIDMCRQTLFKIRAGGIYDQVGHGFHRYSTDSAWMLPHFEKMLYDQALMIMAYSDAYMLTGIDLFRETVNGIIKYVREELKSETGGFYSSQDSDSDGIEGKYYIWSRGELMEAVPNDMLDDFMKNMTYRVSSDKYIIVNGLLGTKEGWPEQCIKSLAKIRAERNKPAVDKKVLVDWNGLMIAALARAHRATGNREYLDLAVETADRLTDGNTVYHSIVNSEPVVEGFLDDYANLAWGMLELYSSTLNDKYFDKAREICDQAMEKFSSPGPFYYSAAGANSPARMAVLNDSVTPSGNSVMLQNMLELATVTGIRKYNDALEGLLKIDYNGAF